MTDIVNIIGNARIEKVEQRSLGSGELGRRISFVGFEGYLVIKLAPDGRTYACIDNNRRRITTSCGTLELGERRAIFTSANSVYTFSIAN